MAYLVLARKYRPSTFSEVVGQEHVTRTLGNAFASDRVHHAFLFCGPRGCGKTTLARIVGKALNCERRAEATAAAPACGECSACRSIADGSAVDYIEMDGASNRGIDAIRELTEAVRYQPAILRKKVYVIDEVHMLTTEAFNALLKTLEEPPPHVTFVLATTEPHKLPNTILSRCQRYDFKLVPASRLAQHLTAIFAKEQLAIEPGAVSLLVRESGGSVRDALSLSDQIISYVGDAAVTEVAVAEVLGVADRTLTRSLVRALATGDAGAALAAVEAAIERGVDEIQLARAIVRYLRDLAVLQVAPERLELVDASDEERGELVGEAGQLDRSRVTQMFDRMLRCCDELGKTLQPRLVLDCALIDVATLEPLIPLGDLIERLGELEGRLAGRGGAARPLPPTSGGGETFRVTAPGSGVQPARPPAVKTESPAKAAPAKPEPAKPVVATPARTEAAPVAPKGPPGAATTLRGTAASPGMVVESNERSGPVSMQPSGPVPKVGEVASGSGPHEPVALPTTPADVLATWDMILRELDAKRKVVLSGYCEHARVLTWTADELVLGFAPDFHHFAELVRESNQIDELRAVLRDKLHQSPKVIVRMLDTNETAGRSIQEASREKSTVERTKREVEAREHPITKHVLQAFGAQIKEIKTDV